MTIWNEKLAKRNKFYYQILLTDKYINIINDLMNIWGLERPNQVIRRSLELSAQNFLSDSEKQIGLKILLEIFDCKSANELFQKLLNKYYEEVRTKILLSLLQDNFEKDLKSIKDKEILKKLTFLEKYPIIRDLLKKEKII